MLKNLTQGLQQLGIFLTPRQLGLFEAYRTELLRWNQRFNLTAITDPVDIEIRHFLDSLTVLCVLKEWLPDDSTVNIIDIGSGAGFPGIPLKLALPHAQVTLLEATRKKAEFLSHTLKALALEKICVIHARAEDAGHSLEHRERYDFAVARAVSALPTLAEYLLPFVSIGGLSISMKKGDIGAELNTSVAAFRALGGGAPWLIDVPLPQLSDGRCLVCVAKESSTPLRYPRRAGLPSRHPLR